MEAYYHQAQLLDVVTEVQKKTLVRKVAEHLPHILNWEELISPANSYEVDQTFNALKEYDAVIDWIVYDSEYTGITKPRYSIALFGNSSLSLNYSSATFDYLERNVTNTPKPEPVYIAESMEAPVKYLYVTLHKAGARTQQPKKERAFIFMNPDMPPTAVHETDLEYVYNGMPPLEYDTSDIDKVVSAFGDDAAYCLTDEECAALIQALRSASTDVYHFHLSKNF